MGLSSISTLGTVDRRRGSGLESEKKITATMEFFRSSFCSFFLLLAVCSISSSPVNDFGKGLNAFATEFYLQCVKEKPGNVFVSPLSVSTALTLLLQATDGSTFEQLRQGLHMANDKTIVADQFVEHRKVLEENAGDATLAIANQIYVQQGYSLKKNFKDVATSKFHSGVESLNFADSEKSANTINHFVEEKTNGKIKELFKSDQFTSDTRSVLVNAIYFKAPWEKPFDPAGTFKSDFYNSETEKVPVDFMYKDSRFNSAFIASLDATAFEMKYNNSKMSFVIVLPTSRTGLTALETKLKDFDLAKIGEKLTPQRYMAFIPKFKVEYEIKLNDALKAMGMNEMFSDNANLRGLLESEGNLKVSDVVHKAFIQVDEKGSDAAAATGIEIVAMSMPPTFRADHPFLFFIRDTETNTIIFSGRIEKF